MSDMFKDNGGQVSDEAGQGGETTTLSPFETGTKEVPTGDFQGGSPVSSIFPAPIRQEDRRGAVIAIDIDDTIAGYIQGFVRKYGWPESFERSYDDRSVIETQWPNADLHNHFKDLIHIEFCGSLLPIDGAFSACHILLNNGFPIVYLTSRPASHKQMTLEWLKTWEFPVAPLFCTGSSDGKKMMMKNLDIAALVDDKPEDIYAARDMGLATFIIDRPWNRNVPGLYRCFSWTHVLGVIDQHWLPIGG